MSKVITFMFAGRTLHAQDGDTVASALIRNNELVFRMTDSNKPRGLFCGMGVCNECAVTVNGKEGILACVTPLEEAMDIKVQKQFRDAPEIQPEISLLPEKEIECDVLIVGAGPAGLAAAKEFANSNLKLILIDERKTLGGQYFKQPAPAFKIPKEKLDSQFLEGRALIEKIKGTNVEVLTGTKIWGAFDEDHLLGYSDDLRYVFKPRKLIIATGAYERGAPIVDWTLPGVFTTGAAQTLLRSYQTSIPGKIVICGNGPLNLQIAAELLKANANVLAYVESAKLMSFKNLLLAPLLGIVSPKLGIKGLNYLRILLQKKVRIISNSVPSKLLGEDLLKEVEIRSLNSSKQLSSVQQKITVDSVALGFGFAPSNEIAKLLGCELELDRNTFTNKVKTDFFGQSTKKDVWVIGDSAAINGAQLAKYRGQLLSIKLLKELGEAPLTWPLKYLYASFSLARNLFFQKILWQIFKSPNLISTLAEDKSVICRCLNVTKTELFSELTSEVHSAGSIKRITRAGMGKCQGRYCSPVIQELLALHNSEAANEYSGFAPQVPIKPTPIGVMAYPFDEKNKESI